MQNRQDAISVKTTGPTDVILNEAKLNEESPKMFGCKRMLQGVLAFSSFEMIYVSPEQ